MDLNPSQFVQRRLPLSAQTLARLHVLAAQSDVPAWMLAERALSEYLDRQLGPAHAPPADHHPRPAPMSPPPA